MGTYQRLPVTFTKGKGSWVWDEKGRKYLDAVAGIATCSLGHSNRSLDRALRKQLKKLQHVSNLYHIPEQEELAQWLVSNSCADNVFFCNSGAEANEAAIKLARKYAHSIKKINNPIILSAHSSFHGRTLAAVSATGQPRYHEGFKPLVDGFRFFSYNNAESFNKLFQQIENYEKQVAAVLIEPIQGEGGVNPGNQEFFETIREICTKNNILLIFDEVQTGMGRTGTLWGYEQLGVEPDVLTLAKGLGGGHAIGALLVKEFANIFKPGDHASTFGGNPFACKAGLTVGQEIEKKSLLSNSTNRGKQLNDGLKEIVHTYPSLFLEVRGLGLIQGLVIRDNIKLTALDIVMAALEKHLLLVAAGSKVVRMVPPLNISEKEVKEILNRLNKSLQTFKNK